jgi:ribonuclease BN (tRNA processing enzyme)
MRKYAVEPNSIGSIFISHMHGDHFGGLPFFIIDAQLVSKRTAPLKIFLPPGGKEKLIAAMEALFPGSFYSEKNFAVEIVEMVAGGLYNADGVTVRPYAVKHSGLDAFALRITVAGKVLSYSGDTEWVTELIECAKGADLFVAEGYSYGKKIKFHLDVAALEENMATIGVKKFILTHMSDAVLELLRDGKLPFEGAFDGLSVKI